MHMRKLTLACTRVCRLVVWVGCLLMLLGYGGLWAQARGVIEPSFRRMLLCGFLAGAHQRISLLGVCERACAFECSHVYVVCSPTTCVTPEFQTR